MSTFEEELRDLLEQNKDLPFEHVEHLVKALHDKHGRKVPPPITGTVQAQEPEDSASGG
jgi:hypothetical protein